MAGPDLTGLQDFLNAPDNQAAIGMLGSQQTPGPAYMAAQQQAAAQREAALRLQMGTMAYKQALARQNFNPMQYLLTNQAAQPPAQAAGPATQQALGAMPGGGQIAANTQQPYQVPPGAIGNVDMAGMLKAGAQAGMSPEEVQGMAGVIDPRTAIMMKNMMQPSLVVPPGATLANPGLAMNQAMTGGAPPAGQQPGALFTNSNPPADSPAAQLIQLQKQYDAAAPGSPQQQLFGAAMQKVSGMWEQANDEDVKMVADKIGHYEMAPLQGNAMRSPISQKVMAAVSKNYPNYNAQNYQASQAASDAFSSGPLGDKTRSLNVSINHLDVLRDAAKALGNGDMKSFNQARQEYLAQTGSAIPTNFDTVHQIVANEVIKAISNSGGTQSERDEMKDNISKASSFQQLDGAVNQAQKLLGGQLNGLAKQYQGATMGRSDFADRYLTPRTREVIGAGGGDSGTGAPPPGGGYNMDDVQKAMRERGLLK